jgi:hypothetical protein
VNAVENLLNENATANSMHLVCKEAARLRMLCATGNFGPDWGKGCLYAVFAAQTEGNVHKFKQSEIYPRAWNPNPALRI